MKKNRNKVEVNCSGCTACCRGPARNPIWLNSDEGDDVLLYKTKHLDGRLALDTHENGDCIHITETGCEVHENKPYYCRMFDCRTIFSWPKSSQYSANSGVWHSARRLLREEGKL